MPADRQLRILFISPFYDERVAEPVEALDHYPILKELPGQLASLGHQVRVLSLGQRDACASVDGVRYRWVAPSGPIKAFGRLANRVKPHHGPAYYQPSARLVRIVSKVRPDIVHVFGLTMDLHLALIGLTTSLDSRLIVHYHGGVPGNGPIRRRLQRLATRSIDTALFTAFEQADSWVAAGLLEQAKIRQFLETSSPFTGIDRTVARQITGMSGNPVYLSVGRLAAIKDPMTMLRGFAHIAREQLESSLYLYYLTDEMLDKLSQFVASDKLMSSRVHFCGKAEPGQMEAIYSSADVLLQASRREWSGLAVLEAMSCGCVPIVSDIPSFAQMTGNGRFGRLFAPGSPESLATTALSVNDLGSESAAVKQYFRSELSFSAMATMLEDIYDEALASR